MLCPGVDQPGEQHGRARGGAAVQAGCCRGHDFPTRTVSGDYATALSTITLSYATGRDRQCSSGLREVASSTPSGTRVLACGSTSGTVRDQYYHMSMSVDAMEASRDDTAGVVYTFWHPSVAEVHAWRTVSIRESSAVRPQPCSGTQSITAIPQSGGPTEETGHLRLR